MKNRIIVTFVLAFALIGATFAVAQPPARGKAHPFAGLQLTPEQRTQMKTIHTAQRAKMEELNKQSLTRQQYRSQAMAIRQDGRKQMEGVLTPDQRAQLQQRQTQRQARRARRQQNI